MSTAGNNPIDVLVRALVISEGADTRDFSSVTGDADWDLIAAHAGRYGVAPLIAHNLRSHVSRERKSWCDRVLTDCWARHERALGHLAYVLDLLEPEGIPVIALKGPLLAQRYYNPPFLRKPAMDLDFAVRLRDMEQASRVLAAAGYTQELPIREALAVSHDVTFKKPSRPRVELHFRLTHGPLGIPVDEFFERSVSCRLKNGREVRILGPTDQLLHLILHLFHARFGTVFHLYEIRRAFRAESPEVRAEAIKMAIAHGHCGALRILDFAFQSLWHEPFLPAEVTLPKTWLNWRLTEDLFRQFELWSTPGRPLNLPARIQGRWLDFQITDTPWQALRSLTLFARTGWLRLAGTTQSMPETLGYAPAHHDDATAKRRN